MAQVPRGCGKGVLCLGHGIMFNSCMVWESIPSGCNMKPRKPLYLILSSRFGINAPLLLLQWSKQSLVISTAHFTVGQIIDSCRQVKQQWKFVMCNLPLVYFLFQADCHLLSLELSATRVIIVIMWLTGFYKEHACITLKAFGWDYSTNQVPKALQIWKVSLSVSVGPLHVFLVTR